MSTLKKYKKIEHEAYRRFSARLSAAFDRFKAFCGKVKTAGRQKLTIMLIPHSEKRILNLQFSVFALVTAISVAVLGLGLFAFSAASFSSTSHALEARTQDLSKTQADYDALRDAVNHVVSSAKQFQTALSGALSRIGSQPSAPDSPVQNSDLASFFETDESGAGSVREVAALQKVSDYFDRSVGPVKELDSFLQNQGATLAEIPSIWPLKGGIGHVSMYYGQNKNPFTGQWYIHTGIDISTFRTGDPIVATANGKIVFVGYDGSFGNNVIIQHSHGFYTRYAHMQSFTVFKGQKVQQGQIIGYLGNTGLTTGPHCHYEVHLGTSIIDPLKFLNRRDTVAALNPDGAQQ